MKIIFILLFLSSFTVQAETIDRIVAKVGSEAITMSDVSQAVAAQRAFLMQTFGQKKGTEEFLKFKKNILNELVLDRILQSQITKEGVGASNQELEQEYQMRLSRYRISEAGLINRLKKDGVSLQEYKNSIKKDLERQKFIQKKIMPNVAISDYDLQQEYEKNKKEFLTYTKLNFIEVFLTVDKFSNEKEMANMAKRIQRMLKSGQSASSLIKKYSSGAYADKGGVSGLVDATALRPEIRGLLSRLKKGQTSNVFPIQHGIFIFKLVGKANPEPIPFNQVVPQLRAQFGQKVVNEELRKYLLAVKDQTYVEIVR